MPCSLCTEIDGCVVLTIGLNIFFLWILIFNKLIILFCFLNYLYICSSKMGMDIMCVVPWYIMPNQIPIYLLIYIFIRVLMFYVGVVSLSSTVPTLFIIVRRFIFIFYSLKAVLTYCFCALRSSLTTPWCRNGLL